MSGTERDPSPREEHRSRDVDEKQGGTSPGEFAGLGIQMVVAILLFLYLGKWIDDRLGTSWIQIVGVFVGAGLSFYNMYRKLMSAQERDEAARKARRDGTP
jgi:F0F1-type ATP synthase assembly protein I